MENVLIDTSAITQDALSYVRNKDTDTRWFRWYADIISMQLLSQVMDPTDLISSRVVTPVADTTGAVLTNSFVFVSILRAGVAMLSAALRLMPYVPVGFIGLRRDEQSAKAEEYYSNLPKITQDTVVIVGDPMLATGGSMIHAIRKIASFSPKEIRLATIICAPEGIATLHEEFPNLQMITAAVDDHLNDKKYIVPGLGDFGDRYFGTE